MFGYYFSLALHSLRRNVALTVLIVAAIGIGIGASMMILTIYLGMAANPIPQKSAELFAPQLDNWGPGYIGSGSSDRLPDQLSYTDAVGLMNIHGARRQAAMYTTSVVLTPADPRMRAFEVSTRATYSDFFPMFNVPFLYGNDWNIADDQNRAAVVVITRELNDELFDGMDSVGRTLRLNGQEYRVVGILDKWEPIPRFYDVNGNLFGKSEDVFVPFNRAIDQHLMTAGNWGCHVTPSPGWTGFLHSDCDWIQLWVELQRPSDARTYRSLLANYAAEQQSSGRFSWAPRTQLRDVRQWLAYHHVVSDEVHILVLLSFSFLFLCLLNAMGLMLARIVRRARDIGVRRALGASSSAIFFECLIESGIAGLIGGLVGLALSWLGLDGSRELFSAAGRALLHLDAAVVEITILLAVSVTMVVGLYPAWRATQVQPALQLRAP